MSEQSEFMERAAPLRAELIAHCYRMLGSVHDAEDLVQETYLRGWRGYSAFEERAALRTWLYRIATTACLRALENRARRVLPLDDPIDDSEWLEPIPDTYLYQAPEDALFVRQSVRLAVMTALQELPARQRAVLILRDVVQFSAAEVAELLETTPAAVNSSLQRARGRLAEIAPDEDDVSEPEDAARRDLVDRYCAAFENADMAALTELLQEDVRLEMPPMREWFFGRDNVLRFLADRAIAAPGDLRMVPTSANAQPAVAEYRRNADNIMQAHSIQVLTCRSRAGTPGIAVMTVFLDPTLFAAFGLPPTR
ncbi:sigma-70 family RNA polymerase sigma factor [Mycobacterium gordonae]|uniref:RNA polymerase sigma factor n=3 Tax=Mycobacterium gordonae TaxID=1778 RepID=A0A1A6BE02_MYCGO|nr:sigma-70 family RNA polymerase sigma factor [Mycobacterium gordonae]MBI2697588.1 sigma-70 family RNA polymerase sigma factor [Mycobacterium sp.]MCQ4362584.1 sigma-70 family RNA polymerase sigma factor [Mycobacterium gordonae]MCV7008798.1 sigma-70 family RNA polymerase sigma factor [Mycobacterium gordonae]OBS00464.1 RNA polymerase subunit sigma-70 [Mycobacterium gordonae]ORV67298.1 RNA polymerase subunit sigma-70 [Mycobacterium gordonae]